MATKEQDPVVMEVKSSPSASRSSKSDQDGGAGPREFVVRVYRLNEEKENSELPIVVNLIGHKRRVISPGKEEKLFDYHIEILRNAVAETIIEIPPESGIYESSNPLAVAESNFPGFRAHANQEDGSISVIKRVPRFSVEIIKEL